MSENTAHLRVTTTPHSADTPHRVLADTIEDATLIANTITKYNAYLNRNKIVPDLPAEPQIEIFNFAANQWRLWDDVVASKDAQHQIPPITQRNIDTQSLSRVLRNPNSGVITHPDNLPEKHYCRVCGRSMGLWDGTETTPKDKPLCHRCAHTLKKR